MWLKTVARTALAGYMLNRANWVSVLSISALYKLHLVSLIYNHILVWNCFSLPRCCTAVSYLLKNTFSDSCQINFINIDRTILAGLVEPWLQIINLKLVFRSSRDIATATTICWLHPWNWVPVSQCLDAVGLAAGRAFGLWKKLSGVVICLERGAVLRTQLMPCHSPSLASVKSRLVLPFWYRLTWVVPEKGR